MKKVWVVRLKVSDEVILAKDINDAYKIMKKSIVNCEDLIMKKEALKELKNDYEISKIKGDKSFGCSFLCEATLQSIYKSKKVRK